MTASSGAAVAPSASRAGENLRLCLHQFRYDLRTFLRHRQSRFFTMALPVMFLVIFASVPALVVTVLLGAAVFCCLGFAVASVIRNEDAAQPITQATVLPLYFISGLFVAASVLPHWLVDIAAVFPVRHLAAALLTAYNPHTHGAGFAGADLLILAAWGIGGLVVALRRFSWLPLGR